MKLIIASLIVFSLIILFLFALFPSDISVSRVIQIRTEPSAIQREIADLREWKNWNEMLSGLTKQGSSQTDRTDSEFIRRGTVTIRVLKTVQDTVNTRWEDGKRAFTGNYILTEMNGEIVLEWSLHFHLKWYPWQKLAGMFYDKQLGPVMENSLVRLRDEVEKK